MSSKDVITVYSMPICPFAQRTRIHLQQTGDPFELVDLDICKPRPDWFLALNPKGQVPVLVWGDDVVTDSAVVGEYIQDRTRNPLSFGRTPLERAHVREFARFVDSSFIPRLYSLMAAQTPDQREERIELMLESFRAIEQFLERMGWSANDELEFGMAEVAIAPFFLRGEVMAYYQDFKLPKADDYKRVSAWRERLLASDVVRGTAESREDLIKMYEDYTIGYFNGAVPPGHERSSSDLSIPLSSRPLPPRAVTVR